MRRRKMLRYYLIAIFASMLLITFMNFIAGTSFFYALINVIIFTAAVFVVDAVVALIVRYLPKKIYNPFKKIYKVKTKERNFLDKIKIKKWKDKIPEMGGKLVGFRKDKLKDPTNNEYVLKFMQETCYAEVMHFWSIFLGFCIIFISPALLSVSIPVACVNAILQVLPVWVQRYNRTRLEILYKRNLQTEKKLNLKKAENDNNNTPHAL